MYTVVGTCNVMYSTIIEHMTNCAKYRCQNNLMIKLIPFFQLHVKQQNVNLVYNCTKIYNTMNSYFYLSLDQYSAAVKLPTDICNSTCELKTNIVHGSQCTFIFLH